MEKVIVSIRKAFEEEKNKCREKEQEWLVKEKAYQEKEKHWQVKEKDWTDERKRFGEREEILKKKLLEDEKQQKEWEKAMQEWLEKEKSYQEKETQWQVKEKNWADERKRFEDKEEILKQKLLEYEKQQSDDPKDPTVIKLADEEVAKVTEVLKAAVVSSTEPKNTAGEAEVVEVDTELTKPQTDIHVDSTSTEPKEGKSNRRRRNKKKNVVEEVKDLKESPTAPQEEPTEPEFEVANIDLAKTKQVDQEDPIVIKVSDKAVVEASKIQDSKESSVEARVVGSAEPKDNGDSTSTKTSDNEVTESKSEVTKPPITETNSDVEKEAMTTGEASSLLITPQETEKIVDESTQTNATASQNSVADPSPLNECYLLRLHKLPNKRTDNNLESTNNSSSRNERSKNRKGRNRKLHWSQRPELVTVVSKELQTEPREAEIKAEDEVCTTDLAMPQLEDHKDLTIIKPADEEGVEVKEAQDSKDSSVEAADVSSAEPKNTAGEAEVVEADTELTEPQKDVDVDSTSTEPKEGKSNRKRRNKKKNGVEEVKDLKESPTAAQEEPTKPEFEVANIDLAKTKQVDQEDPTVIKVSDKAVAEASKIQDSKESSGEARVVGSAEPKDNDDSTSTKTSDNEVTESKSEVTKPPITETNSDVEKEAMTTGEASSLLITPQETEKIVDESTQTNITASQNSVADPSPLNECYLLRLHKLPNKRTDNNLESANNSSSSRNERSKNRKGRNRQLHWSQRPELVTVVSKEPQTEPREAEIKAEDEVCNTDLAMPQLEDHKDLTIIKPADEEGVKVKEAQDSKDSSVEAADVSSAEPKDTAGEAEVVEADTELTEPQKDVDVDSTSTEPKEGKSNRKRRNKKKNGVEEVKDLKESPTAAQEEPTKPEFEVTNIDLAKTKQVDQEDPTVIKVSDKAVAEASKIQDSKESSGEARVVGSAEPKDNGDSTSTKTSDNEVTESRSEVTKPPITETNSDVEKEAMTTGEASSLLITPQETEKIVDESTQTNATASQNSVADPSPLNECYLLRLHKLPNKRTDNNLESANNSSSSRNERSKNRKGRNRQLHWSQRPELVTVVSKEPQTEPREAEIKAEDEVCNTDLAMPQLEDHKDLTIIKPADEEGVKVKEAQDSKDSSVEAADVSSAEPKNTAGEAEVVEADTELTEPQKDVDVDSTSTEPKEGKSNRKRRNKKKNGVEEVKDLKESPTAAQEEPTKPEFGVANIDLAKTKQVDQEDPTVIKVSDKAVVEASKIQDSKESSVEAAVVSSAEPKDTAGEANTAFANPQIDVDVDTTSTEPTKGKRKGRRKNKKGTGDDTTNLRSREWFF